MTQNKTKENNCKGTNSANVKSGRRVTSKQVVAIVGIVLLVAMYLLTLITALFDNAGSMLLFRASLIATFTIPLLIWVYIWMYGKLTQKHTIADFDLGSKNAAQDEE